MTKEKEMSFWDHLDELRWRIIYCLISIIFTSFISYLFWENILFFLLKPSNSIEIDFQVIGVTSMFIIKLSCVLFFGVILSLPIYIYNFWKFIEPAIHTKINFSIIFITLIGTFFFLLGLSFGYFILVPFSLNFFTSQNSSLNIISYNFTLDNYLYYIIWLIFISGTLFQLPIITIILVKVGILTPEFLRHYRKYTFVFFLILGAILTPPDPFSQILVVLPLILLYELSIILSTLLSK